LALGNDENIAKQAAEVLKTQVFLYEADTTRLKEAFKSEMKLQRNFGKLCKSRILSQNFLKLLKKLKWLLYRW
jgi:aconitate hydratase 2/2-methylisocitrate dehydratase